MNTTTKTGFSHNRNTGKRRPFVSHLLFTHFTHLTSHTDPQPTMTSIRSLCSYFVFVVGLVSFFALFGSTQRYWHLVQMELLTLEQLTDRSWACVTECLRASNASMDPAPGFRLRALAPRLAGFQADQLFQLKVMVLSGVSFIFIVNGWLLNRVFPSAPKNIKLEDRP